jgi:phage-related protein (TIGR01555 family)
MAATEEVVVVKDSDTVSDDVAMEILEGVLIKAADGLENAMSGMGGNMDKTTANVWRNNNDNDDHIQLINRYRMDWVSQKVCNIVPADTTREWRKLDSPEAIEADKLFNVSQLFHDAYKWARVYGTAAILIDVKGSGAMDTVLDIDRLGAGCIQSLQVIDRTRLFGAGEVEVDPLSPRYGQPKFYMIAGSTDRIHNSRLIRFEGTQLPMYENWRNHWYSDSVLIPLMELCDSFHTAVKAGAQLVTEASTDVVTINGLQNMLTSPAGEAAVMKRFRLMKQMKSIYNVILLDSNEEYDCKKISLSGVKDMIWEYLEVIAAAVGIPATRFLSASPSGMNATGESDLVNYVDLLVGVQVRMYEPRLTIIDEIIQKHCGLGPWKYEWNCIYPESAAQKEERDSDTIESIVALVVAGVITAQAAQNILVTKGIFSREDLGAVPTAPPAGATKPATKTGDK